MGRGGPLNELPITRGRKRSSGRLTSSCLHLVFTEPCFVAILDSNRAGLVSSLQAFLLWVVISTGRRLELMHIPQRPINTLCQDWLLSHNRHHLLDPVARLSCLSQAVPVLPFYDTPIRFPLLLTLLPHDLSLCCRPPESNVSLLMLLDSCALLHVPLNHWLCWRLCSSVYSYKCSV